MNQEGTLTAEFIVFAPVPCAIRPLLDRPGHENVYARSDQRWKTRNRFGFCDSDTMEILGVVRHSMAHSCAVD
jgi:hypothetical protein